VPKPFRLTRWLLALTGLAGLGFAGVSAYFAFQFTKPARRAIGDFTAYLPASTETVQFAATDGVQLAGWFVPQPGAKRAVVLLHGYGSSRKQMLARAKFFHDAGYAVFLYDARGQGTSSGDHVSIGLLETRDLQGALAFLRGRGLREFGLLGESQGGATIAIAAPELRDIKWVVLESSYPTLRDAIDRRYRGTFGIPGWLGGLLMVPFAEWRLGIDVDDVSPIAHIGEFQCPVFILHGDRDQKTLVAAAHALFARAHEPKSLWIVPGAAHVDLYGYAKGEYEQRLRQFIERASTPEPTAAGNN
jgi:fermentation-respiration switch protein FrsA (DUF1100 family)